MPYKPRRDLKGQDPVSWALRHRKINGEPLDHRSEPYQVEPMMESWLAMQADEGERGLTMAFMKGRQIGITTAAQSLMLCHLDLHGGTVIHAVPTKANVKTVNGRLNARLRETTFDNLRRPQQRDGLWNETTKEFKGRPEARYLIQHTMAGNSTHPGDTLRGDTAEIVVYDERATMPQAAVAVIRSTTNRCVTPILWHVGSARDKGDPLDETFRRGTRAEWAIPCDFCGKHTIFMEYGSGIDQLEGCLEIKDGEYIYACEHCRREIDPRRGEWTHNEGKYPSYHVAAMCSSWYSAFKLAEELDDPNSSEESLMREVAGLPFGGQGVTIDQNEIQVVRLPDKLRYSVMGIDWGSRTNYVLLRGDGDQAYAFQAGTVDGRDETHVQKLLPLAKGMDRIACDFGYDMGRSAILNDHTAVAWTVRSNRTPDGSSRLVDNIRKEPKTRNYSIVKSWVWEKLVADLRSGALVLGPGMETLRDEILAVVPETHGKSGNEFVTYNTTNQHYASALLYAYAVWLREHRQRKGPSVGYGNPLAPGVKRRASGWLQERLAQRSR